MIEAGGRLFISANNVNDKNVSANSPLRICETRLEEAGREKSGAVMDYCY